MTKKIIQSIGTTFRYSSLSDNTKFTTSSFYYYVLPSMFKNMKHVPQPTAPAQCCKSSQIDHSENGKKLHDDTKGGASKIDMDHSQNIQTCTCAPQNAGYPTSLLFTPTYCSSLASTGLNLPQPQVEVIQQGQAKQARPQPASTAS